MSEQQLTFKEGYDILKKNAELLEFSTGAGH